MTLDPAVIARLTVPFRPKRWLRVTPLAFKATPLGLGYGKTRFASADDRFKVLYISPAIETGVAETIIRDRFVGKARRLITQAEIETWGVTEIAATADLNLLDIRTTGLLQLGVSTDAARAKSHKAGRAFGARIFEEATAIDGLLYPSRLTGGACVTVYERAVGKLDATPVVELHRHAGLAAALKGLNVQLVGP